MLLGRRVTNTRRAKRRSTKRRRRESEKRSEKVRAESERNVMLDMIFMVFMLL